MDNRLIVLSVLLLIKVAHAQDEVGQTFIGEDVNDTSTFFSYNENYAGTAFIPVYIGVFNETTGDEADIPNEPVTVNCEFVDETEPGFTVALFQEDRIVNDIYARIDFDNVQPGRPVTIQCWGESPSGTFTKESSMSAAALFEIRPAGKAYIPGGVVIVPNTESETRKEQFIVQLTDVVEIENVTVTCVQNAPNGQMILNISDGSVIIGKDRAVMEVLVYSQGNGQAAVNCTANSRNGGLQFQNGFGQQAFFLLDQPDVSLLPVVTELKYPEMTAFLVLDASPDSEVIFYCNLTEVEDLDAAIAIRDSVVCDVPDDISPTRAPTLNMTGVSTTTTDATGTTVSTTVAPTNTSAGIWQLSSNTIEFESEDFRYKALRIFRTNRVQADSPELVAVKCCAPPELNLNPKYNNTNAAFLAIAYISPEKPINWTEATDAANLQKETEIKDPAFVELGPCPCDLTENQCDVDCCCDPDCDEADLNLFTCIPGIQGGQSPEDPRYKCSSDYFNQPGWFRFLCVEFESSGYLGLFRMPINATRDDSEYTDLASPFQSYSYEETTARFDDNTPEATEPYIEGFAIKTGIRSEQTDSTVDVSNYFRLTIPQRTWTGKCVTEAPVRYLVDNADDCVDQMKEDMCTEFSRLSSRVYAQSSGVWENQAAPQVLRENAETTITYTNTNYYCLTEEQVQDYLSKTVTAKEIFTKDRKYFFDTVPENFTDCDFNAETGAYICGDLVFENDVDTEANYTRCSFDDGFTQAPAPELDASANISVCDNAVLDVLYSFTWKGSEIERLDATVLLGSIPLEVEKTEVMIINYINSNGQPAVEISNVTTIIPTVLTQKFTVDWSHSLNESIYEDADVERPDTTEVFERSGKPGYNFTLPLFSGVDARNDTTDEFLYIDTNSSKSLSLWNPANSGLCEGAGRSEIEFGIDATRSCMLRLGLDDLLDCDSLRKLILFQQDSLMISNYISSGGDPNRTSLDRWISIFREDISSIIGDSPTTEPDSTTVNDATTDATVFPDVTTEPGNGADADDGPNYVDGLVGRCPNIPSNIHSDIMYALVGKVENVPVYEVIGAQISYSLTTWQLICAGEEGLACTEQALDEAQTQVQTFTVSSSVSFIEVPASIPTPLTAYQVKQREELGTDNVCKYNLCRERWFYPFTQAYAGDQWGNVLGLTLVTVGFLIAFLVVILPCHRR